MPGDKRIRDPIIRRARAEKIISMRAAGASQEQVARAFDVSTETVRRTVRWAEQNGLLDEAKDRFLRLLDKSTKVYERRLDDDAKNPKLSLQAAHDIAFGTGVLSKTPAAKHEESEELSLSLILKRRRAHVTTDSTPPQSARSLVTADDYLAPARTPDVVEGVIESIDGDGAPGTQPAGDNGEIGPPAGGDQD